MADKYLITFKDYPAIAKPSKRLQAKWEDNYFPVLNSDNGLRIKVDATHSGIINKNMRAYIPSRMRDGVDSFMSGKPKKILKHHDSQADPVGIIRSARYVSTIPDVLANHPDVLILNDSSNSLGDQVAAMKRFMKSGIPMTSDWTGFGYVELEADILDETTVKQVASGLFDAVSTSFVSPGHVYCSYCNQNLVADGMCGHVPGETYTDDDEEDPQKELCVLVPGLHDYKECSLVVFDADPLTAISIDSNPVELKEGQEEEHKVLRFELSNDNLETDDESIFQFRDFKEENNFMDPKLKEILDALKEMRPEAEEASLLEFAGKILASRQEDGKFKYQEELKLDDQTAILYELEDLETAGQEVNADEIYELIEKQLDELKLSGSKLSADDRSKLPENAFCGPDRSFPVVDEAHVTAARAVVKTYKGPGSKSDILANVNRKAKVLGCNTQADTNADEPGTNVINPGTDSDTFVMPTCADIVSLSSKDLMAVLAFAEAEGIARSLKMARDCSECASHVESAKQNEETIEKLKAELLESSDTVRVIRQELKIQYADFTHQVDEFIALSDKLQEAKLEKAAMVSVLSGQHPNVEDALGAFKEISFEDAVSVEANFDLVKTIENFSDGLSNDPDGKVTLDDAGEEGAVDMTDENQDGQAPVELSEPAKEALKNVEEYVKDGDIGLAFNLFAKMKSLNLFPDTMVFDSIVEGISEQDSDEE